MIENTLTAFPFATLMGRQSNLVEKYQQKDNELKRLQSELENFNLSSPESEEMTKKFSECSIDLVKICSNFNEIKSQLHLLTQISQEILQISQGFVQEVKPLGLNSNVQETQSQSRSHLCSLSLTTTQLHSSSGANPDSLEKDAQMKKC
jgi:hypothetical protein